MFWWFFQFGDICVFVTFVFWWNLQLGNICVLVTLTFQCHMFLVTFACWWHLYFVFIWFFVMIKFFVNLYFGDICVLVKFAFWWHLHFDKICVLVTFVFGDTHVLVIFAFWWYLRFGDICVLLTFFCFGDICVLVTLAYHLARVSQFFYLHFICIVPSAANIRFYNIILFGLNSRQEQPHNVSSWVLPHQIKEIYWLRQRFFLLMKKLNIKPNQHMHHFLAKKGNKAARKALPGAGS